ncbi:MAG: hypothetical protein LW817_02705 [Candidatus Caenarcaniphilales bacterium]|jgi:hypothetical protein|nr:hypothetical protein [Candidatus Caenarcaniphilales bacterium]
MRNNINTTLGATSGSRLDNKDGVNQNFLGGFTENTKTGDLSSGIKLKEEDRGEDKKEPGLPTCSPGNPAFPIQIGLWIAHKMIKYATD